MSRIRELDLKIRGTAAFDFYFPTTSFMVTALPKNASSFVLARFIESEGQSVRGDVHKAASPWRLSRFEAFKGNFFTPGAQSTNFRRIVVVRHPGERYASAWLNKFVLNDLAQAPFWRGLARKYGLRTGFPIDDEEAVQENFMLFLESLVRYPRLAKSGGHWAPQWKFLGENRQYDFVVDQSQIAKTLFELLGPAHSSAGDENVSVPGITRHLGSFAVAELGWSHPLFSKDFERAKELGVHW